MQRHYSHAEAGPSFDVVFNEETVSLDIPEKGITLPSGWSLTPLVYPARVMMYSTYDHKSTPLSVFCISFSHSLILFQLLHESVDNYKPGHPIPSCQIKLAWMKVEEPPKELSYELYINGVNPPDTFLRITRRPTGKSQALALTLAPLLYIYHCFYFLPSQIM